MSKLQVNDIVNKDDNGSVGFSKGAIVTGVATATSFDGDVTGDLTGNVTGNVTGNADTATTATNAQGLTGTPDINVGVVTASGLGGVAFATVTTTAVSKTLINREYCTVTAAGQTITLPASPQNGHEVGIAVSNFRDTTVTAGGNELIMGSTDDLTIDLAYTSIQLVYNSTGSVGWRFF
jgi:hypothetical protein